MTATDLYLTIAAIFAISTIPVVGECLIDALNPRETAWNRRAGLLWAALCLTLSALWPLLVAATIALGLAEIRNRLVHPFTLEDGAR